MMHNPETVRMALETLWRRFVVFVNTLISTYKIMKFSKGKNWFACLANNKSNNSHTEPKAEEEREQAAQRRKQGIMKKAPGKQAAVKWSFLQSPCPSVGGGSWWPCGSNC